jgi:hypothetical protein
VKRRCTLYLLWSRRSSWRDGNNMTLVSATTNPPTRRPKDSVLTKLRVEMPDAAFDPAAIPSLVADIPLDAITPPTVDDLEVVIEDPEV